MSRDQKQDESPIESRDQLLAYFHAGVKKPADRRVGTEHEKFMVHPSTGALYDFEAIESLLFRLREAYGYEPGFDDGRLVALERGDEAITLEPGGQFELSGGLKKTIFETEEELKRHFRELKDVGGDDLEMVCLGLNPYDDVADLGWVPKSRYKIMREYLPTRAELPHWMMKLTCTIQANLDFTSEADAVDMMRTSYLVSPLVNALFANSPVDHGKPNGYQSYRAHIWTKTDPDRTGVPDFVLSDNWGFEDYLEFVLDAPLFFIRRDERYVNLAGQSFRTLMNEGIDGYRATMGDFELHLSTVFPEVRLKRYIEVRSGDGGPITHMTALPALWKGILYDAEARRGVYERLQYLGRDALIALMEEASRTGIHGVMPNGEPISDVLRDVLRLARQGLERISAAEGHPSEAVYLDVLDQIIETQNSQADRLLQKLKSGASRVEVLRSLAL